MRNIEISFDGSQIAAEFKKLPFETLQHILDFSLSDRTCLSFDVFLCESMPARIAGSADQVIIGLSLSVRAEGQTAA